MIRNATGHALFVKAGKSIDSFQHPLRLHANILIDMPPLLSLPRINICRLGQASGLGATGVYRNL
jgi:hypothetical protein